MNAPVSDHIRLSFSRSFETNPANAKQQAWVAQRLGETLRDCGAPGYFSSTFEIGSGTGLLTRQLCAHFRRGHLTLNDLAPETQHTADTYGASFLSGDALQIGWPDRPTLIASASMIQWLSDPCSFLRRASDVLAPGGWLAISGFGPGQYQELAQLGISARAPGLCCPDAMTSAVQDSLDIMAVGQCLWPLYFASARDVLVHLRRTGVNGSASRIWTKARHMQFLDDYTRKFTAEAGVRLTYQPVWIVARKPG